MNIKRVCGLACVAVVVAACGREGAEDRSADVAAATPAELRAHSALFERVVLQPAPGVYVAVGFGLANSIMIEGDDGIIIVDTMESRTAAREVLAAFRAITDKPVVAIVLTHNHADHVFGGEVFAEGRDVPVYAHASTGVAIDRVVNVVGEAIYDRSMRMFGVALSPDERVNAGIGLELRYQPQDVALRRPTHVFEDELELDIAGVRLTLVHAPGETDDQLFVWLPERGVLLPGDNIYETFPNLYTIRGTPYRDVTRWVDSLDRMRDLAPDVLVPQHTRPVVGAGEVDALLTAYRDAIQYVHDQTVRMANAGLGPDEIAARIALPPHLAEHPWLQEFYGTPAWSARSVFTGYFGWFDGDVAHLEPLAPDERARRLAAAMAAGRPIGEQARAAVADGELAWAIELARWWERAEPDSAEARDVLAQALELRGQAHANPNARHWYLTAAREARGDGAFAPYDPSAASEALMASLPIDNFMHAMGTRLKAEETLDVDEAVAFEFTDLGRVFTVHIRRGVAEVRERDGAEATARVITTSQTWKLIGAHKKNAAAALASGELRIEGGLPRVLRFLGYFDR